MFTDFGDCVILAYADGSPGVMQLLQHLAAQGMGDAGGMHGAFPPNLPPQLASLMQVCMQSYYPLSSIRSVQFAQLCG